MKHFFLNVKDFLKRKRTTEIFFTTTLAVLIVASGVYAATTIGNNISTEGIIEIGGTQVLSKGAGSLTGNLFVGDGGGTVTEGGTNNTAVGFDALKSTTDGFQSTAVGAGALYSSYSYYNTAVGANALYHNTTGDSNVAVGISALNSDTQGHNNIALGRAALSANTSGNYNVALGRNVLSTNITGSENVALGYQAGNFQADGTTALTDPENSVYLGSRARGKDNSDSNSIVIGSTAIGIGANSVVLGNNSIVTTALKGNVGIGTTAPGAKLDVDGIIKTKERATATCDANAEGGIYYDSDDSHFYGCDGTTWHQLDN